MNVYAWLSLSASIISVLLGVTVYSLNRKKSLNKLFMLTALAGFYWTFTEFMMWQASNAEIAYFWNKMGFLWPFFAILVLHFSLVYTENKWLKNKFTYVLLYLPAPILAFTDLTTELINGPPIMQYWGYEDTSPATLAYGISTIWSAMLPVLALLICAVFTYRVKEGAKKQQSKLVTIGFAIPIFTYLVTNMVFPSFAIDIPNLGHIAILFFGIFTTYAILKYELFTFDAAMAAENIISTIPDSLILADMNGKMLKVNKRLLEFMGHEEHELIGKSLGSLCVDGNRCVSIGRELTEKRVIRNVELTFMTKSGEEKTVLFSGSVVRSKTGRDIGIACVIHDITEHKKMEEKLVKAERLASIGELTGQIGHDLRNPLTAIKNGAYYLIKREEGLTESGKKMLKTIDNAVDDSDRIISCLIDYASDLRLDVSPCTPKSLFSSALRKIEIPKRIEVIDHLLDEPEIFVDVDKLENVITRIIANAIEAMPQNGTLELRSTQKGSDVEMAFVDSGVGIPENVLPKVFSPLVTTKAKGMGLGLAICKRIVGAHDGKIAVESTEGKGSTFVITLPVKPRIELAIVNDWVTAEASSPVREN